MQQLRPILQTLTKATYWSLYNSLKRQKKLADPVVVQELAYLRGFMDFAFFARYFFQPHCEKGFSRMHLDFIRDEANPHRRARREAIAAPRGHAKTTLKLLIKTIHAIVYGYDPFIVIMGQSALETEDKVQQILDELSSNPRLIQIFGMLAPVPGKVNGSARGGRKSFVTANGIKVLARSRGQSIRGVKHGAHRPTLIICDDIETLDGVQNPEQRAKTRDWFFKDVMKCGQTDGSTNVLFIDTCLHVESLLSELLHTPGWLSRKYQAIEVFSSREDLWDQWRTLYTDLSNMEREEAAQAFYVENETALLDETVVLWPEGESYLQLMKQLVSEGAAAFHSEKQNEPYNPEQQLFDMTKAKRFRLDPDTRAIHWLDGSGRITEWSDLVKVIAFHDPALGEKPSQHSDVDFAAIVVVAKDQNNYMYVLDCYLKKAPPSCQVEAAFSLHRTWSLDSLYLETNHFQDLLRLVYRDAQEEQPLCEKNLRIHGIHQHQNKIQRISTLEPDITNGHLLFSDSLDLRLIQQLILFPTTHDDGPDALQGAVYQLKRHTPEPAIAAPYTSGDTFFNPYI